VVLQTLTRQQVRNHLEAGGDSLRTLCSSVDADSSLMDLLRTPLMLWIATSTYRDTTDRIRADSDLLPWQLFDRFVDVMFKRRNSVACPSDRSSRTNALFGSKGPKCFSRADTMRWLGWLATTMKQKNETIFHLESLDLTWLQSGKQQTRVRLWFAAMITVMM